MNVEENREMKNNINNSSASSLQANEFQLQVDSVLEGLVLHFDFDFERVATSFSKYMKFLQSIYPNQFIHIDDLSFTPNVCRARYSYYDWKKQNHILSTQPVVVGNSESSDGHNRNSKQEQIAVVDKSSIVQQPVVVENVITPQRASSKPIDTLLHCENEPEASSHNIFRDSLERDFNAIYESVKRSLPSIDSLDNDEDETEVEEIFKADIPPPTEFESQFLSDENFWEIHENPNYTLTSDDFAKEDKDLETLEKEWDENIRRMLTPTIVSKLPPDHTSYLSTDMQKAFKDLAIDKAKIELELRASKISSKPSSSAANKQPDEEEERRIYHNKSPLQTRRKEIPPSPQNTASEQRSPRIATTKSTKQNSKVFTLTSPRSRTERQRRIIEHSSDEEDL